MNALIKLPIKKNASNASKPIVNQHEKNAHRTLYTTVWIENTHIDINITQLDYGRRI